jgi:hypothetical protein
MAPPIAARGFFTVEVWTYRARTRFVVVFLMELSTRRVEIAGVASDPESAWISQVSDEDIEDVLDTLKPHMFSSCSECVRSGHYYADRSWRAEMSRKTAV